MKAELYKIKPLLWDRDVGTSSCEGYLFIIEQDFYNENLWWVYQRIPTGSVVIGSVGTKQEAMDFAGDYYAEKIKKNLLSEDE